MTEGGTVIPPESSLFDHAPRRLDAFVRDNLSGDYIAFSREEARELVEAFDAVESQARHWLAWFNEPADAKTWDLNIVAAATRALLKRLDEVRRG